MPTIFSFAFRQLLGVVVFLRTLFTPSKHLIGQMSDAHREMYTIRTLNYKSLKKLTDSAPKITVAPNAKARLMSSSVKPVAPTPAYSPQQLEDLQQLNLATEQLQQQPPAEQVMETATTPKSDELVATPIAVHDVLQIAEPQLAISNELHLQNDQTVKIPQTLRKSKKLRSALSQMVKQVQIDDTIIIQPVVDVELQPVQALTQEVAPEVIVAPDPVIVAKSSQVQQPVVESATIVRTSEAVAQVSEPEVPVKSASEILSELIAEIIEPVADASVLSSHASSNNMTQEVAKKTDVDASSGTICIEQPKEQYSEQNRIISESDELVERLRQMQQTREQRHQEVEKQQQSARQTSVHLQQMWSKELPKVDPLYFKTEVVAPQVPKTSPVTIDEIIATTTPIYNVKKNPLDMFEDILAEIDQRTEIVNKKISESVNQAHFDISSRFSDVGSRKGK